MPDIEVLKEIFEVTEWKDGAVFRTKSHGLQWKDLEESAPKGWIYAAPSTGTPEPTIRRKKA